MNRDLFLAILAMDSYNRGYGAGVTIPPGALHIGRAEILPDSEQRPEIIGGQAAGFYALAYDVSGAGIEGLTGTVVSYRGSDNFFSSDGFWSAVWTMVTGGTPDGDLRNGYGVAFGYPDGRQARLAIEFYQAVAGSAGAAGDLTNADITLTGHSLGGGLAGLVAGLYNRPGFFVDPMQFGKAVDHAFAKLDPGNAANDDNRRRLAA